MRHLVGDDELHDEPGGDMALNSMTGFGRAEGASGDVTWVWELRSVNGRGLDLRLRLPAGTESLEVKVRERLQAALSRGSVTAHLSVQRKVGVSSMRVNREAIAAIVDAVALLRRSIPGETQVNIDGLLALRGVLEDPETAESEAEAAARSTAMLASLDRALADLKAGRAQEGVRLGRVLAAQIDEIERLVHVIAASPARTAEAVGARLAEQLARLSASTGGSGVIAFDAARLHQEAMLIVTRLDIEEELKRLTAHVAAARDLLEQNEPVGRKLDFLTQEFNREANTLCSKSGDIDITRSGLGLKALIDQMREQVQNLE